MLRKHELFVRNYDLLKENYIFAARISNFISIISVLFFEKILAVLPVPKPDLAVGRLLGMARGPVGPIY